jgi:hypothetical protein
LYYVKSIKEQKVGPFGSITTNVIEAKPWRHPFLYHWILSFFSTEKLFAISKYLNPIIDALYSVSVVILTYVLSMDWQVSFLVGIVYLTCPMWFSVFSIGPRIKSFTPRLISEIGVNLFFIIVLLPIPFVIKIFLAIIIGAFVLLSSKFGIQAIVFLSIIISITDTNLLIIELLSASILFSIIITRGQFLKNLKEQYLHLKWYFISNLNKSMPASNRNNLFLLFQKNKTDNKIKYLLKIIFRLLKKNSFTGVILKLPIIVVFYYYYIFFNDLVGESNLFFMANVIISATILFVITNIRYFLFLGEAERYLNHISFFLTYFVVYSTVKLNFIFIVYFLALYGLIFLLLEFFLYDKLSNKFKSKNKDAIEDEVILFLNNIKKHNILCYPFGAIGFWRIMYQTKHKLLYPITCKDEFIKKYEDNYNDKYPFANLEKVDLMNADFGLDLLIIDTSYDVKTLSDNSNWIIIRKFGDAFNIYVHKNSINE